MTVNRYLYLLCSVLMASLSLFAQTGPSGNLEIYSRERSAASVGYLKTSFVVPQGLTTRTVKQDGFIYTRSYGVGKIGEIVLGQNHQFVFTLEGCSRLGLGTGTVPDSAFAATGGSLNRQVYVGMVDAFALDFAPEYTFIFGNGYALTLKCNFGLINVGMTAALLEKGQFNTSGNLIADLVPLSFEPSLTLDLGRSGFGVRTHFNKSSLLAYRFVNPPNYGQHEEGLTTTDSTFGRFWVQAMFTF